MRSFVLFAPLQAVVIVALGNVDKANASLGFKVYLSCSEWVPNCEGSWKVARGVFRRIKPECEARISGEDMMICTVLRMVDCRYEEGV